MHKVTLATAMAALLLASVAAGQTGYLVPGVGTLGNWDTYLELANPFDQQIAVALSHFAANAVGGCDFGCNVQAIGLPAHGSQRIMIANGAINPDDDPRLTALAQNHVLTLFIAAPAGTSALPVVHVHAVNRVTGRQTEFPVYSFRTILNRVQPTQLTFPGASKTEDQHCNLVLTSIEPDLRVVGLTALLQLHDSSGALLGTKTLRTASSDCLFPEQAPAVLDECVNSVVLDVVGAIGIASLDNGVLDVTQTSGGAAIWGHLDCVQHNGSVVTYAGANP